MTLAAEAPTVWHRLAAAARRPLRRCQAEALDGAALRDLGLSRSELGSFEAEASGIAAHTRRRLADLPLLRCPPAY